MIWGHLQFRNPQFCFLVCLVCSAAVLNQGSVCRSFVERATAQFIVMMLTGQTCRGIGRCLDLIFTRVISFLVCWYEGGQGACFVWIYTCTCMGRGVGLPSWFCCVPGLSAVCVCVWVLWFCWWTYDTCMYACGDVVRGTLLGVCK